MSNKIFTLHERGAISHFYALEYLLEQHHLRLKHREINILSSGKKLLFKGNFKIFINIYFLISLLFRPKCKIVLAIAPYNRLLPFLLFLIKRHKVYYFTSYSVWDQSMSAYPLPKNGTKRLNKWRYFTSSFVEHIFAVSNKTKQELIRNNFAESTKISVVYHSLPILPTHEHEHKKTMNFICVARLIPEKGIEEIIEVFKLLPKYNITFVGCGALKNMVIKASNSYSNIRYLGYISDYGELIDVYKQHSFVILNSQHLSQSSWEELFGITLLEGMSCGCVPIATPHIGAKEIINNGVNGFLFKEGKLKQIILELENINYQKIRRNALISSIKYYKSNIAKHWKAIL